MSEEGKYLPTPYEQLIHKSRYARWIEEENRREDWPESVARFMEAIKKQLGEKSGYTLTDAEEKEIRDHILNLKTNTIFLQLRLQSIK